MADATCETVLTAPAAADIVAAGYLLHTELPGGPEPIMSSMLDQGGLSCYWATEGFDVPHWYGQVGMDAAAWTAMQAELVADGYTESDDPIPGTMQGSRWGDDNPALVNRDGVTYYVNQPGFLSSVAALR